jgi:hypothetical protein
VLRTRLPLVAVILPVVAVIPVPAVIVVPADIEPRVALILPAEATILPRVAVKLPAGITVLPVAFPIVTVPVPPTPIMVESAPVLLIVVGPMIVTAVVAELPTNTEPVDVPVLIEVLALTDALDDTVPARTTVAEALPIVVVPVEDPEFILTG